MKQLRNKRRKSLVRSSRFTFDDSDIMFGFVLIILCMVKALLFIGVT
jgi:hypothetical protein